MPYEQVSMYAMAMHLVGTTCSGAIAEEEFSSSKTGTFVTIKTEYLPPFKFLLKKTGPTI